MSIRRNFSKPAKDVFMSAREERRDFGMRFECSGYLDACNHATPGSGLGEDVAEQRVVKATQQHT